MRLDISHATRACRGEVKSGDAVVVRVERAGVLFAVVDALGHGPLAADAAETAVRLLRAADLSIGLRAIMGELHEKMRATRGAAATLCLLRGDFLEASGVGNVGLRSFGMDVGLVLSRGVIGSRLRQLFVFQGPARPNARLVLFSDGIQPSFGREEAVKGSPLHASERLLARYGRDEDDATVLVADTSEEPNEMN